MLPEEQQSSLGGRKEGVKVTYSVFVSCPLPSLRPSLPDLSEVRASDLRVHGTPAPDIVRPAPDLPTGRIRTFGNWAAMAGERSL